MVTWSNVSLLELVEAYARYENIGTPYPRQWIEDEERLSELFDQENGEWLEEHRNDQPAINEAFNNWTDALCKEGHVHPEQYDKYEYVGKYSD